MHQNGEHKETKKDKKDKAVVAEIVEGSKVNKEVELLAGEKKEITDMVDKLNNLKLSHSDLTMQYKRFADMISQTESQILAQNNEIQERIVIMAKGHEIDDKQYLFNLKDMKFIPR